MFHIGPYQIQSPAVLAPMAGITDQPFRRLCKQYGAGMVTAEMLTSDTKLWNSRKSQQRLIDKNEAEPRAVQIAGAEPAMLAQAAQACVDQGAQIVDINMGCPAKKVCNKAAGSALLRDEKLVADILQQVVAAVDIPVTLKIRTGWSTEERNGLRIARIAEDSGIQALTVHGRSRACRFKGEAEYDTIADIVQAVNIPVIANGDITQASKAQQVLKHTQAAAIMVGRGAQGRPWIFREINHYLAGHGEAPATELPEIQQTITQHLEALHQYYGDYLGLRIARKHMGWYLQTLAADTQRAAFDWSALRQTFNRLEDSQQQQHYVEQLFDDLIKTKEEQAA
ncbi:tRNA dihydrouridine synthase DusB [Pseudoteredinibacter isoporae]|uniref:tRNA-dihydrouridine synthase B n=1 Tax=Pseudoteredinibacter isoporae TaxID=570281 RepID=A0A7X0JTA5_9GAMM|nr:tRNA dihydrouridine synthase DusB [Pseudoteredinibacter isoporae]MBB6520991.1 tRNA-dihydrouridine synthase B [Pseudoteredinibacter isoporae]NHO86556.1 tRNA dihydrouridine synthase DusB [Pseudoteredinibacter isoporae]NIB24992.1 tRNA dihydrouridine synthase DusB [Pseudoteredinibacter isoporae]